MTLFLQQDAFAPEIDAKRMVLLINSGESFPYSWLKKKLPGSFFKDGQTGHSFQVNAERYRIANEVPTLFELQDGRPLRVRAELSAETCWSSNNKHSGKPICDPPQKQPWGFYAMTNFVTTVHLDFWNVQPGAAEGILEDTTWAPMWRLLNRYAGTRWPRQAPGAWIAFRDGLDGMDSQRFGRFGTPQIKDGWWLNEEKPYPQVTDANSNTALAKAICKDNKARGCKIEDESALTGGSMNQRHAQGVNDVGFGNWRGDYGNFMRLIAPESNTLGWWRVGSEKEMYGRFARGYADPTDESAEFPLSLDRGLWGGLPLTSSKRLAVRVLFFDQGSGTFTVHYDDLSKQSPALLRVQKTNTGTWKEACAEVTDGHFGGRGPQGSDIWIRNTDQEDDILGGLEIADLPIDEISLKGCDFSAADVNAANVLV
jgi:hypothetical protein